MISCSIGHVFFRVLASTYIQIYLLRRCAAQHLIQVILDFVRLFLRHVPRTGTGLLYWLLSGRCHAVMCIGSFRMSLLSTLRRGGGF